MAASDIKKGGTGLSNEPTSNRKTKCPIHGLNCDAEGMFSLLEAENEAHASILSWLGCGSGGQFDASLIPPGRLVVIRAAMPGRIMLSNVLAIVVKNGSARAAPRKQKQSGKQGPILVCALCPEFIKLPGSAQVHDMNATESSFMPGTYRRLTDESLGGGRLLAMVEVSYLKIVRICEDSLDAAEIVDTAEPSASSALNSAASSRSLSDAGFGSGMLTIGRRREGTMR